MTDQIKGIQKVSYNPSDSKSKQSPDFTVNAPALSKFPPVNGLEIEMTEKRQYRIREINTGVVLPFVLQDRGTAIDMQYNLVYLMIVQETCQNTKKLQNSCMARAEASAIDKTLGDLYIDNSNLFPGEGFQVFDYEMPSEKIEAIIRGDRFKHSLKNGTLAFTEGISTFLNDVQDAHIKIAKRKPYQVAQK